MASKNPYNSQKTFQTAEGQLQSQNKALDSTSGMINPASQALSQFYSPSGQSQYAKTQQTALESATNRNFNNSLASQRMRARMSGMGYEQPAEQTGETNVENARASALAQIPAQTQQEAAQMGLQAIGEQNALAGTQLGIARAYDPESYYGTAVNQYNQEQARKGGLFGSLANLAGTVAAPFTAGLSKSIFK